MGMVVHFSNLVYLVPNFSETFNERFGEWLWKVKSESVAAGWAVAVEEIAARKGVDPVKLFLDFLDEFIDLWPVKL